MDFALLRRLLKDGDLLGALHITSSPVQIVQRRSFLARFSRWLVDLLAAGDALFSYSLLLSELAC